MGQVVKRKQTILVVDDEEDTLVLMKHKLKEEGFNIQLSPNAENIIDLLTTDEPDLILLDIHMKGVDGGTICQLIKTNGSTAHIPVVMFSANDNVAKITSDCGANGYIKKPFNTGQFKTTFADIMRPGPVRE